MVFDPFSGTGTTLVVAKQLSRRYLGVEIDPKNVEAINNRLSKLKNSDNIEKYRKDYVFTENLDKIWHSKEKRIDEGFLFNEESDDNLVSH